MAPEWGRAIRPLVLVFTAVAFAITIAFRADVSPGRSLRHRSAGDHDFGGFRRELSSLWNRNSLKGTLGFGLVTLIFAYTTVANIIDVPTASRSPRCSSLPSSPPHSSRGCGARWSSGRSA